MPQDFSLRGPLAALEPTRSETAIESFYYPSNLTTVTNHYVRFDCNIFENSRFRNGGIKGNFTGPVDVAAQTIIDAASAIVSGAAMTGLGGVAGMPSGYANLRNLINKYRNLPPGATTAALNYANSLPEPGEFYKSFPGLRGIGHKRTMNHIYLYTPDTVTYDYKNNWQEVSLREIFGMTADGVSALSDLSGGQYGSAFATSMRGLLQAFGSGSGKSMFDAAAAMKGFPVNPLTETLFKNVSPRGFQFNFKFYPQTQHETDQIYNIIEQFAFHAAPEYASSEVAGFMIMPSTFDIKFMFLIRDERGEAIEIENPWIRRISTCGLESISVDYSPDGQWSAMEDGSPRALTLALQFKELEVITKDRVKRGF